LLEATAALEFHIAFLPISPWLTLFGLRFFLLSCHHNIQLIQTIQVSWHFPSAAASLASNSTFPQRTLSQNMTVGMAQRISQSQEQEFVDIFPGTLFVGESFGEVHKKTQVAKRRNKKKHSTHCGECDKL